MIDQVSLSRRNLFIDRLVSKETIHFVLQFP